MIQRIRETAAVTSWTLRRILRPCNVGSRLEEYFQVP